MKQGRSAGILLAVSSLPSPYGIGTLGKCAFEFIDQLKAAGQSYWQVLPVGPTSFGDSPYQSFSAFAGNPYFIDLDLLVEDELLTREEILGYEWGEDPTCVDYAIMYHNRFPLLHKAYERSAHENTIEFHKFQKKNSYWLEDYSLYMALKFYFNGKEWLQWEENIRYRQKDAVRRYQELLHEEIGFWKFLSVLFLPSVESGEILCEQEWHSNYWRYSTLCSFGQRRCLDAF